MSSSAQMQTCCLLEPEHLRGLLVHVDAEEVSLRNTMKLLRDLPIHSMDDTKQRELRVRIEQSLHHAAFLMENRQKVLRNLSQYLGIPSDQLCFSALLPYATPAAAALLIPARQRLQKILVQVKTLASTAAWIVNESRRIQLTIMDSLPGSMNSDRYDAFGQRNLNPAAFRFETRS